VTATRKRVAQDALGSLQLDGHRAPGFDPDRRALIRSETLSRAESVGQVAVPFRHLHRADERRRRLGSPCPFRHRCLGCTYSSTDPSYQPELRAYLGELLARPGAPRPRPALAAAPSGPGADAAPIRRRRSPALHVA